MSTEITKDYLVSLVGRVVVFNSVVDDYEDYPEEGMKARIKQVSYDKVHNVSDRCHRITLDYGEFDEFNKVRETANYYDSEGRACLTAREAGFYKSVDVMFVGGTVDLIPFDVEDAVEKAA